NKGKSAFGDASRTVCACQIQQAYGWWDAPGGWQGE
ncbi:MAG: hypothetical protein K0Q60_3674, partial [Microvirga sp.]|nr:hypothetical protein [Microvirga sp.]